MAVQPSFSNTMVDRFFYIMTISEKSKIKREKASRLAPLRRHIDVPIFVKTILITALIVALYSQTNIIDSRALVQLTIPIDPNNSNIPRLTTSAGVSNNGATMTISTTNLIQGNNLNAIEPVIMHYFWQKVV
jgi:hypothetical protein